MSAYGSTLFIENFINIPYPQAPIMIDIDCPRYWSTAIQSALARIDSRSINYVGYKFR